MWMSLVLSVGLLGLAAVFFLMALRLHRRLETWYRDDASRLWKAAPWRWTMPVLGLGAVIIGAAFLGAATRVIESWAFLT